MPEAPGLDGAEDRAGDEAADEGRDGPSTGPTSRQAATPPSGKPAKVTIQRPRCGRSRTCVVGCGGCGVEVRAWSAPVVGVVGGAVGVGAAAGDPGSEQVVGVVGEVVADEGVEQVVVAARWAAAMATSCRSRVVRRRARPARAGGRVAGEHAAATSERGRGGVCGRRTSDLGTARRGRRRPGGGQAVSSSVTACTVALALTMR